MVTATLSAAVCPRSHKEADGFYFQEGILFVMRGKDIIAAYPQIGVAGVVREDCCCQS